jgi:hypothetical protein
MIEEIKTTARRHLAVDGANLRYVPWPRTGHGVICPVPLLRQPRRTAHRALCGAYNSLGVATEQAGGTVARSDLLGRWLATCRGVRDWARANPHEYALIYGSPVPGYAPRRVSSEIRAASRVSLLSSILRDGHGLRKVRAERGERIPRVVRTELAQLGRQPGLAGLPEAVLARGVTAWVHLFGLISFELFGRLDGVIDDLDAYFDYEMGALARRTGIG